MGALTTHVLDTSAGQPGAGVRIALFRLGAKRTLLLETCTNSDGRCDQPLLEGEAMQAGEYELVFEAGDYFKQQGLKLTEHPFLGQVPVRFGISHPEQHYHVPLLLSPYAYSTYRGS